MPFASAMLMKLQLSDTNASTVASLMLNNVTVNIAYIFVGTSFAWSSPMLMKLQLSDTYASTVASLMLNNVTVNIAYIFVGTSFAWSSPMLMKLQLSDTDASTVASLMSLGGVFGPFVTGAMVDRIGRKGTSALSMGLAIVSYILLTARGGVWVLATGRFFAGISYSIIFSALPMYIAEISEVPLEPFLMQIFSTKTMF
ncbi:hypothetical protein J6590_050957 [Homalodisca vitripennis]|nr:hypothetical protein J6590_050957 [Homalodisca vitripennis]